jgi:hypothetical protein
LEKGLEGCVIGFEAQAWQDDPSGPIASAFGHFMFAADRRGGEIAAARTDKRALAT